MTEGQSWIVLDNGWGAKLLAFELEWPNYFFFFIKLEEPYVHLCQKLYMTHSLFFFLLQVGLALSYAAPIVSLLGSFLSSFTETEKEMVSVERVLEV